MAMKLGRWRFVKQCLLPQMGDKMQVKAKNEEDRIELKRGIQYQFLQQREKLCSKQNTKDDPLMEEMVTTMIELIYNEKPFSDDNLLLCWKYECDKVKKMHGTMNGANHRLWNAIQTSVSSILIKNKNKRVNQENEDEKKQSAPQKTREAPHNFQWFKNYLLPSSVELTQSTFVLFCFWLNFGLVCFLFAVWLNLFSCLFSRFGMKKMNLKPRKVRKAKKKRKKTKTTKP